MSKLYAPVWVGPVRKFAVMFVVIVLILTPVGVAWAADGEFSWARSMGGGDWDTGFDIALDRAGNVYTTGFFQGTADFDPGPGSFNLTSSGSGDIFVSKLDSDGNFVWARSMGGSDEDIGKGVSADGAGNVYTIGRFQGTVDFDPGPGTFNLTSAGAFDIFVSKLDSDGDFVWALSIGSSDQDKGFEIALDETGNVYITGLFEGTVDFDPGPGEFNLTSNGDGDIFVSKLNSDGNFVWARSMGGSSEDIGLRIAVDGAGNVYTNGCFRGTVDFDPGPGSFNLSSVGDADMFVSKLDSDGNFAWAWSKGSTGFDEGLGIAVDGTGNVYTTALLQDAVASPSDADIFVGKLDSAGDLVWAHAMGSPGFDKGYGIALDRPGDIYITGTYQGTVDFDPGPGEFDLTSNGDGDIFVSKLDSDGNFVWARSMGGTEFEEGIGIAVDETGSIYTAGRFQGTADFDPGPGTFHLTSSGFDDIFVSKLTGSVSVGIYTDKVSYLAGETMHVGLDMATPGPAMARQPALESYVLVVMLRTPSRAVVVANMPLLLPPGWSYSNPDLFTWTLPALASGTYAWIAMLIPVGEEAAVDHAFWEFTGVASGQRAVPIQKAIRPLRSVDLDLGE